MKRIFNSGNSMVEYALPLGIFFVSGLAILMATDVTTRLGDFFSDSVNGANNGGTIAVAPYGSPIGGQAMPGQGGDTFAGAGAGADTGGVGNTSTASGGQTETTGGLGNDDTPVADSSNALNDLADDLEDSNAPAELVALINNLANSGHDLAQAQSDMPRWADINTGDATAITDALLTIQGNDTTPGMVDTFQAHLDAINTYLAQNAGAMTAAQEQALRAEADNIIAIIDSLAVDYSGIMVNDNFGFDPYYGGDVSVDGGIAVTGGDAQGTEGSSNNACAQGGNNCTQDSNGDGTTTGGNGGGGG